MNSDEESENKGSRARCPGYIQVPPLINHVTMAM